MNMIQVLKKILRILKILTLVWAAISSSVILVIFVIMRYQAHQDFLATSWISSNGITHFKKNTQFRNWNFDETQYGIDILYYKYLPKYYHKKPNKIPCMETNLENLLKNPFVQTIQVAPRIYQTHKQMYCSSEFLSFVHNNMMKSQTADIPNFDDSYYFVVERPSKMSGEEISDNWQDGLSVTRTLRRKAEYQGEGFFHISLACNPYKKTYVIALRNEPEKSYVGLGRVRLRFRKGKCLDKRHEEGLNAVLQSIFARSQREESTEIKRISQ